MQHEANIFVGAEVPQLLPHRLDLRFDLKVQSSCCNVVGLSASDAGFLEDTSETGLAREELGEHDVLQGGAPRLICRGDRSNQGGNAGGCARRGGVPQLPGALRSFLVARPLLGLARRTT